jgi:hypothetical protein
LISGALKFYRHVHFKTSLGIEVEDALEMAKQKDLSGLATGWVRPSLSARKDVAGKSNQ